MNITMERDFVMIPAGQEVTPKTEDVIDPAAQDAMPLLSLIHRMLSWRYI
tara:strand:- start:172 stop:321 length:150 start_codon:yes stop_codon:yes gene_type:complete